MRICFIGDSFVNGVGDPLCQGWVGRICAQAKGRGVDLTAYNLGIRRDTSRDIAARWRAEALARQPSGQPGLLVFSFGVNDCCPDEDCGVRVPLADSLATAHRILAEARTLRPTLMVGPPPIADDAINARTLALITGLSRLCGELAVPFFDTFLPLSAIPVWAAEVQAGDGAHPAAGGYDALAALIGQWPAWQAALAG